MTARSDTQLRLRLRTERDDENPARGRRGRAGIGQARRMTAAVPGGAEAREIQHAIDMLVELIPDAHDSDYPDRVQRACRESFAMNARLLIDFVTGTKKRDINASDFTATEWAP